MVSTFNVRSAIRVANPPSRQSLPMAVGLNSVWQQNVLRQAIRWLIVMVAIAVGVVVTVPADAVTFSEAARDYRNERFPQAVRAFESLAQAGDVNAQYVLGIIYRDGKGVTRDTSQARKWFLRAAQVGYAPAQADLAMLPRTQAEAGTVAESVSWLRKAAEQGNISATVALADAYRNGAGVEQSDATAVEWYRRAAEKGVPEAQLQLAIMYDRGFNMTRDLYVSRDWLRRAAHRGLPEAQQRLGVAYERGDGVRQDFVEAAKWYELAARQGLAWAQFSLGTLYEEGRGVAQNAERALWWYTLADRRADEQTGPWQTGEIVKRVSRSVASDQRREIARAANSWQPSSSHLR